MKGVKVVPWFGWGGPPFEAGNAPHIGNPSFSRVNTSNSRLHASRARERDGTRIFSRHSLTHAHRGLLSSMSPAPPATVPTPVFAFELRLSPSSFLSSPSSRSLPTHRFNLSRPSMGAKLRKLRNTNFNNISGLVNKSCTVLGVGLGVPATVCKISPIWHVTAVHGNDPMKEPKTQSRRATPHTPHAMLMPDQGTMPIRRRMERRTQAEECEDDEEEGESFSGDDEDGDEEAGEDPSMALRVISRARG